MKDTLPSPPLPEDVENALLAILDGPSERHQGAVAQLCAAHPQIETHIRAYAESYLRLEEREGARPRPGATRDDLGADALEEPERFGHFRLLGRLGLGGMGTVHLAFDERLEREVALKQMRPEHLASEVARVRFAREARALSCLDHPHLCRVFDAGHEHGVPYLVMQYVAGETLGERIEKARNGDAPLLSSLPARGREPGTGSAGAPTCGGITAVASLIEKVARALHHAHEAGLVHRDIKPGNIMIKSDGEPVVVDFGLVRNEGGTDLRLTGTREQIGTPSYMAPEQIVPSPHSADRRTDVYALGVTLYECLTLSVPFAASTPHELFEQILRGPATDPGRINRHIPRDLRVIVAKAMEKEADRRYQTALDLAEDLRRVRSDEPILAQPPSRWCKVRRWVRREPLRAALAAVSAVLFATLVGVWLLERGAAAGREENAEVLRACVAIGDAHKKGQKPLPEAIATIQAAVTDERVREPFLRNPLDPVAILELGVWLAEHVRGGGEDPPGLHLVAPRAAVAEVRPLFRFRTGLPDDRAWHFAVRVESLESDTVCEERARQPVGGGDVVELQLAPDHALRSGGWRWTVRRDHEQHADLPELEAVGELEVVSPALVEQALAGVPKTGDDVLDRQLEAAALLAHRLATRALDRLDVDLSAVSNPVDRARHLLLQGRAHALLGARERVADIHEQWRALLERANPWAKGPR